MFALELLFFLVFEEKKTRLRKQKKKKYDTHSCHVGRAHGTFPYLGLLRCDALYVPSRPTPMLQHSGLELFVLWLQLHQLLRVPSVLRS